MPETKTEMMESLHHLWFCASLLTAIGLYLPILYGCFLFSLFAASLRDTFITLIFNFQQSTDITFKPIFISMKYIFTLYLLALYQNDVRAFSTPQSSRQDFMKQLTIGIASVALPQLANAAAIEKTEGRILRSDKCAYGEGEGCESLAGDNEFIKELQRKSSEKKEAAQKVSFKKQGLRPFFHCIVNCN